MILYEEVLILPEKVVSYPVYEAFFPKNRFKISDYKSSLVSQNSVNLSETDKEYLAICEAEGSTPIVSNTDQKCFNYDLSKNAFMKLKYACNTIYYLSEVKENKNFKLDCMFKWRLNFITLTLPVEQFKTDKYIVQNYLTPFLLFLRRKFKVHHYIWKAEAQLNGNLHFHIVTDKYCYYETVRNEWNTILYSDGWIDRFRDIFRHSDPNSTDVHSIRKADHISAYFIKYFNKKRTSERRQIECTKWNCSRSLSYENRLKLSNYGNNSEFLEFADTNLNNVRKDFDYCTIYNIALAKYQKNVPDNTKEALLKWKSYINSL
jgi:hypothetical protein